MKIHRSPAVASAVASAVRVSLCCLVVVLQACREVEPTAGGAEPAPGGAEPTAGKSEATAGGLASRAVETVGSIERLDPRVDALVPPDAAIEKLADGFDWSEGPVWVASERCLLFSDVPRNVVYRWKEGEGVSEHLKPSGATGASASGREPGSNGLILDAEGRLVLCQHGDRCVGRIEKDGSRTVLADRYEGKRLNSPNDAVYGSGGDLYFTDPPYGLDGLNADPAKELDFNGVFLLRRTGELVLLTREMTFPNGIALSPDGKILYVANSDSRKPLWMAFDVNADGTISGGRVFFDAKALSATRRGGCDGLKVDSRGNLYATGPGGVLILAPDGTHLGTLLTGVPTANCAWGEDGSVLFITADSMLCRIRLAARGAGF